VSRAKRAVTTWRARATAMAHAVRAQPTLVAVAAEGFLTRLGFSMIGFALPLYALSLGMGVAEVGLLYALRTATTLIVKPAMGWAADRFGAKPTLIAAVVLRCLAGALFIFATLPWHLYAIRLLQGAMTAAREPSAAALIAEHGDKHRMASAFAWYTTARDVGRSLGYGAAGLLVQATGSYRAVFLIAFLTSCLALVTVIRYVRESQRAAQDPVTQPAAPLSIQPPRSRYRGLLGYAGFGLMVASSAEMMRGLFPVIATQYARLTAGEAGLALSASSVVLLLGGPLFGWLFDHGNRKLALGTRSMANTLSSLLYIFFPTFAGFLIARVMDDTGKAAFRPTWGAILAEASEAEPGYRARIMTYVDTAHTLGEVLGPLAAGLLLAGFGAPVMLGVRAALSLATEIQALRVFKHRWSAPSACRESQVNVGH
jgi:MFS family permease